MARVHLDDLKPGDKVYAGYRNWKGDLNTFRGFKLDDHGMPRAMFTDEQGSEWESYLFNGKFCVGSSADPLKLSAD